ncbi:acyl-CoA dehydrogenase family protein [Arthrobacter sp. APC 3897]|uniref:acyl-CoA dehydrogenase family protein n=1 Tax=Arthrobacter sp. APC 3897 TaxID=3035204 RepID=UPI0025B288A0|nr:acyl-CoA dehydrogenase family protein [Arthrobacter sp. APC 3897]MDN3481174.1 acyl-CoA dehydrogenase family protein [Arthrobacter sp. APC 3897]
MDFSLTDEQNELVKTLRAVLKRHADSAAVRSAADSESGYDPDLWRTLAEEVGVSSLAIPEEYGGAGYTWFETGLALETLGYQLAPSPLLASAVLAASAVLESDEEEARGRLLPGIAEGSSIATLAWADERGVWSTTGSGITASSPDGERAGNWTLDGTATLVLDGVRADTVIAVANTPEGVGLFEVLDPAAVQRVNTPAVDTTIRFATLTFEQVPARALRLDAGNPLERIRDIAVVMVSCLQVGTAQRGLDMSVEYSKQRVQFGRAIGSFQALKHRMADMLVQVETARTTAWAAAWSAATDAADLPERAASAAAWCADALDKVAAETVQIHGGIAITWEHDAQLVFKRAHSTGQLFGSAREHRRRLGMLLGIVPQPGGDASSERQDLVPAAL